MDKNNNNSPLRRFFGAAEKIELALGGLCLATLFVVVLIGIASRLMNVNAAWYEETTRVFFLWMMWIGVGAGFNHSESSRVTVLVKKLPEPCKKICYVLYYDLTYVKGYIDGCIPLALVMIVMIIVNVMIKGT